MEGERRRLIHAALTRNLRAFAGTEIAQAAWSRTLSPDFSRERLGVELAALRGRVREGAARERMFGGFPGAGAPVAESRAREWDLSREVLVSAFRGLDGAEFRASLAHSRGAAIAIAVAGSAGVGVDLEPADREISDAAFSRFFRSEEGAFLTGRLDHWVLKEACFKAHPRSSETIVADYVVVAAGGAGDDREYSLLCAKGPEVRFRAVVGSVEEFRYAFAIRI